jgi:flagellar M-ring protein FliF
VNLDKTFAHLRKLATTLSVGQLTGLAAVFVAVVGVVIASAYWLSQPSYMLLVADMDAETASSVVSKLKADKVRYQLTDGGRSVRVPAERVDELRLEFASGGLPSAGRLGFEIFDRPAFGTTEFLEQVNYRRALEGELSRTIATLSEVESARVHIAKAKDSLFVDQAQPAKASVVLKLRGNRPLPAATVRGIAGLVAGSVESLRPESVVILDTFGRPLSRPEEDGTPASAQQFDRQQQIEKDLTSKVVALLEPVVGAGRVRVNVSASLKTETVEETEERFDPNGVVRSRQTSFEASTAAAAIGGIAGARANQPPALSTSTAASSNPPAPAGAADATLTTAPPATPPSTPPTTPPSTPPTTPPATASAATATNTDTTPSSTALAANTPPPAGPLSHPVNPSGTGSSRSAETTNYEVGRVTRHTVSPQGQLARLSVAVILDDERVTTKAADGTAQTTTRTWEPAGLQRIQSLVTAAVGLDAKRGDQLTVENIPFDVPMEIPEPAAPGFSDQALDVVKENWPAAARGLAIVLVASFALFGVLRPLARRAATAAAAPALPAPASAARLPTVQEMEGTIDAELEAARAGQPKRLPVLTKRVAKLANDEPEQLARIVRGWIAEGDR